MPFQGKFYLPGAHQSSLEGLKLKTTLLESNPSKENPELQDSLINLICAKTTNLCMYSFSAGCTQEMKGCILVQCLTNCH